MPVLVENTEGVGESSQQTGSSTRQRVYWCLQKIHINGLALHGPCNVQTIKAASTQLTSSQKSQL